MRTRILVAALACAAATLAASRAVPLLDELLNTRIVPWSSLKPDETAGVVTRKYFDAPTSTLLRLGLRARTLAPGTTPHPAVPNSTANEQVILVKEGTLEVKLDPKRSERLEPGSALFLAPNQWHELRNATSQPVTYYELDWTSPGMNGERQW